MKNSFILYHNFYNQIKRLTKEQQGSLFCAIFKYEINRVISDLDPITEMLFSVIKDTLDFNQIKYQKIADRNTENIQKRWSKRKNTKNTSGKTGIPKIPDDTKNTDTVIVTDTVTDTDIVINNTEGEKNSKEEQNKERLQAEEVYCYFSETIKAGRRSYAITRIRSLLHQYTVEELKDYVAAYWAYLEIEHTEHKFWCNADTFFDGEFLNYKQSKNQEPKLHYL